MSELDLAGLLGSLSGEDIQKLKSVASQLLTGGNTDKPPQSTAPQPEGGSEVKAPAVPEAAKISPLLTLMSEFAGNDERTQLLTSLKPFLSPARQAKADEAVKLIHLMDIIPKLREQGIF